MTEEETVILYRPVGNAELALLEENDFRRWPPRLPEQPIFYPVTNEKYAAEIAERWNAKDGEDGYVTKFRVKKGFMEQVRCTSKLGHHITRNGGFPPGTWTN